MKHSKFAAGTRIFFRVLAALVFFSTSACQPVVTPAAVPTARVMTVQLTPAMTIFAEQYRNCAAEIPGSGLVALERPASAFDDSSLALRWGAGSAVEGYAAVIGQEELVVVVHPQNPLSSIRLSDLQAVYQGSLRSWQAPAPSGEIQAWAYPAGDDARAVFEGAVLNGAPAAESAVSLAPNPAALREAVAANPTAIGFLPRRWAHSSVKILPVEGLDAALLWQPLLALSKSEPKDPEKSWLICLQEEIR